MHANKSRTLWKLQHHYTVPPQSSNIAHIKDGFFGESVLLCLGPGFCQGIHNQTTGQPSGQQR